MMSSVSDSQGRSFPARCLTLMYCTLIVFSLLGEGSPFLRIIGGENSPGGELLAQDEQPAASDADKAGEPANDDFAAAEPAARVPGRFLTLTSPVDDLLLGKVKNTILTLQNQAVKDHQEAVLILEITPGTSPYHQAYAMAKLLTSQMTSHIRTVAWVPDTVTGYNVLLALACKEIVMHPYAELGDVGRGQPLDADEQQSILSLVENRHNQKVNRALVQGMFDQQASVLRIKLQTGTEQAPAFESRSVTPEELDRLRESRAEIHDVETIKDAGVIGLFRGERARQLDVLVMHLANSRAEVADIYQLNREAMREDPTSGEIPNVRLIRIDGMIEPILHEFIDRQIQRSLNSGVNLLIFEIDSPGGYMHSSIELARTISELDAKKVKTVAYVPKEAISGAAIIALGCDEIYMHPRAKFGDAGAIHDTDQDGQFELVPEKLLSVLLVNLNELAKVKNRPPGLAEAMSNKELKVFKARHAKTGRVSYKTEAEIAESGGEWIAGPEVPEAGRGHFLTVNGERAHELQLAEPPVADMDELKQRLGVPADVTLRAAERTWVDTLVFVLNTRAATAMLFIAGAMCIYFELYTLTGFFGIMSAVFFSMFFWSRFLGGTAGWLEVVFFLLGVTLLSIEIFLIPGFGVFGVSGGLLLIVSVIMASQTFGDIGPSSDVDRLVGFMGTLSSSLIAVVILASVLNHFMPRLPFFRRIFLTPPGGDTEMFDGPRLDPGLLPSGPNLDLMGQRGRAVSMLRPSGKAEIGGRYLDVVSQGDFIPPESPVEVVHVSGNRIVVRGV
ncbi:MAG: NfeD family protein [Planctomycetaceae bacterium]